MHRKIAIWIIVFVSISGCAVIVSNYLRSIDKIELENGAIIKMEVNENIMAMRDPLVSKKISIDYGKRQIVHKSDHDDYNYRIYLIREKEDTIWILQEADGCQTVECSYSDPKAEFVEKYWITEKVASKDTLLKIEYTDFDFTVE